MKISQISSKLRSYVKQIIFGCAVLFLSAFSTLAALAYNAPLEVSFADGLQRVDKSVELTVSKRIKQIDLNQIKLSPVAKGSWSHQVGTLSTDDKLVFTPTEPLIVDTNYDIQLPTLSLRLGSDVNSLHAQFATEQAPGLADSTGLTGLVDEAIVAADQDLKVKLTSKNRQLRQLELRTKPKLATKLEITNDTDYQWQINGYLPQGKKITFEIYDKKNKASLLKRTLTVAAEPQIATAVKTSYFNDKDMATIVFKDAIDPKSEKFISFSLPGKGSWRNQRTYDFKPTAVEPGKTYQYTIKKGLRSKQGGIVTKDASYNFQTIGPVRATASPFGSELSQSRQEIRFNFDQPVNHQSVEKRFSLSSGKIAGATWSGNSYIVTATGLGFQRTVTATVGAGVVNAGFGLPSRQAYSTQFTTEIRSKKLNVPYYAQQQSSTCTAAALRMTLGYRGVGASEMSLVHKMGYKPREMNRDEQPHVWDDPDEMFVGYANGGSIFKGAGPDAGPVAKAAQASGRSASAVRGISASWIAQQLYAGNPVIMFGATRDAGYETWKTPTGKTVKMNRASHVVVVTGVRGEANNPIGFWINDPLYGSYYWTTGQVQANIARDVHRQAVVVY